MEEETPTNQPDSEANIDTSEQYEPLSKADAMGGVFTSPGETYETIARTQKQNYWLIPVVISILVGVIATFLFMRDAELVNKTMEKQKQKVREKMEENVKAGKMTQEESQRAMEQSEKFMNPKGFFFMVIGYVISVVGPFIWLLIWSVVYLIVLKIMKAEFAFYNVLNVVGLAMLIMALGKLVAIVVSILRGDLSGISPALILTEEAVGAKIYAMIMKLDVFDIWHFGVVSIGLSKIASISLGKSASFVFGIWLIVYVLILSLVF